jgi:Domain of unknown function (DUF4389)
MSTSMTVSPGSFPTLQAERIADPNRLWAFPILGILVKALLLIPFSIWLVIVEFLVFVLIVLNSLAVLFTGAYWRPAYDFTLGFMRLTTKLYFYVAGLTDKYPSFGFEINDRYSFDMPMPEHPSRGFAIPFLGGIARVILLIPFAIWVYFVLYGTFVGLVAAAFVVLFRGAYLESVFELVRDSVRLQTASIAYIAGLSDSYPSFTISTNHGTAKVVFIVLGVLLLVGTSLSSGGGGSR